MNLITDVNSVLTVALVIAIVTFFKTQLKLKGWAVLVAAFLITLFIAFVPPLISLAPAAEPWLVPLVNVIVLFLAAAGTQDFVMEVRTETTPPQSVM